MDGVQTRLGLFSASPELEDLQLVAESYTGIYSMHKYWSKKPFNLVRNVIMKYSEEGQIILDPFCGSGISITEAIFTKRKAIGIDINPVAVFITQGMLMKIAPSKIETEFINIRNDCEQEINKAYELERDGRKFVGTHFIWTNDELKEIWYEDSEGKKIISKPTSADLELAKSYSYSNIQYRYPKAKLFHNSRINAYSQMHVYELFTPRNLYGLSLLLNRIDAIEDAELRELFRFCFTASLGQSSKMVFVVNKRGKFNGKRYQERKEVGSWVIGYWIPREKFEINVWKCFETRYRRILKAKKSQYDINYVIKRGSGIGDLLTGDSNLLLENRDAISCIQGFPDDSVDYVITDPPHGNRLPYLELSMMWNDWLGYQVDYEREIVVSDSTERNKSVKNYYLLLGKAISEIERVLKPDGHFTLMFNSLDNETWENLFRMTSGLRFELADVGTMGYSATSVVQDNRTRGLKSDFVLTFRKLKSKEGKPVEFVSGEVAKIEVRAMVDKFLTNNPQSEVYRVLNDVIIRALQMNRFYRLSDVIDVIDSDFKGQVRQIARAAN
jgi:SAM-dependent methyltransferase